MLGSVINNDGATVVSTHVSTLGESAKIPFVNGNEKGLTLTVLEAKG